jgi:DNA-binding NarL/FixJ family response regulator
MEVSLGLISDQLSLVRDIRIAFEREGIKISPDNIYATVDEFFGKRGNIGFEVMLIDCRSSDRSYLEHYRQISMVARFKQFKVIVLADSTSMQSLAKSVSGNIIGFFNYREGLVGITGVVQSQLENYKVFITERLSARLASKDMFRFVSEVDIQQYNLTEREVEVANHIIAGSSSREIGEKLAITASTVNIHRSHILRKFNLKRSLQLVILFTRGNI